MVCRPRRLALDMARRLVGLAAVVASVLTLGAPAAAAHVHPSSYYVALGDSLAAGYQPDRTISRDEGYVPRIHTALGRGVHLVNLACDGANTTTLLSGGGGCAYDGVPSQLAAAEAFLRAHRGRIR